MNRLQDREGDRRLFVTLNPHRAPRAEPVHPSRRSTSTRCSTRAAIEAQSRLWSLQGVNHTWFCGAYFGAGFHEDGLQAGLAVAEDLGGVAAAVAGVATNPGAFHLDCRAPPAPVGRADGMSTVLSLYRPRVAPGASRRAGSRLGYRTGFWMLLDLDEIDGAGPPKLHLFSRGRFNLFGFRDADYGERHRRTVAGADRDAIWTGSRVSSTTPSPRSAS